MMLHDAPSPKRTLLYSPMVTLLDLDLGQLSKAEKERRTSLRTVRAFPLIWTVHDACICNLFMHEDLEANMMTKKGSVDSRAARRSFGNPGCLVSISPGVVDICHIEYNNTCPTILGFLILHSLTPKSHSNRIEPAVYLRAYTTTFGKNIIRMYDRWQSLPAKHRGDIRGRIAVDLDMSDKEIFELQPLGDMWLDSRIHEVFLYLYNCKYCKLLMCKWTLLVFCLKPGNTLYMPVKFCCFRIPDSWTETMRDFKEELAAHVPVLCIESVKCE